MEDSDKRVAKTSERISLAGAEAAARRSLLVALLDRNDREVIKRRALRAHRPGTFGYLEAHGRFDDD